MRVGLLTAVATAIAIGAIAITGGGGGGGGAGTANLWIDTTGGTCTRQPTAGAYVDAAACTFANALTKVQCGDTVSVQNGNYSGDVEWDFTAPSGCSQMTTWKAENGLSESNVVTGHLSIKANWTTVNGFYTQDSAPNGNTCNTPCTQPTLPAADYGLTGVAISGGWTHVTVTNVHTHAAWINNASNVLFQHVTIGPTHECDMEYVSGAFGGEDAVLLNSPGTVNNSSITFDDVTIHDNDRWSFGSETSTIAGDGFRVCDVGGGDIHTDAMQVASANGFTITNSHIYNGATSDIFSQPQNGSDILDNWTFTNTEFGPTIEGGSEPEVQVGSGGSCGGSNVFLFENSVLQSFLVGCSGTPAVIRGNVIVPAAYSCTTNATYSFNTFASRSASCAATTSSKDCTPTWSDSTHASGNYDTASADTCARNAADPTVGHFPATDNHGVTRPIGAAPDAGANEAG